MTAPAPATLKIDILSDAAAPHTRRWAQWFALRGHDVRVLSFNSVQLPDYAPAVVHELWNPRFGNALPVRALKIPTILARMRVLFRQRRPDLIHAHSAGGYAWAALLSGFRPYVVTPWGTDLLVDIERSRINQWLTTTALARAELVTTDGQHFVDILRRMGVPAERILLHSFGTNVHHFSPGPDGGERQRLGVGPGPVVISTRTLNPVHDVETFIRALPAIHDRFPAATFLVVGGGAEQDRLEQLADSLHLREAIRFTGMVDEHRMRKLLRTADVYVSTSLMDAGLAGSTAEAMATGLPVVQTDNSDNARWTPSGAGGLLFPNRDPGALAACVCQLLAAPDLARTMGQRNRSTVVHEYNIDLEMGRIDDIYRTIAGPARR